MNGLGSTIGRRLAAAGAVMALVATMGAGVAQAGDRQQPTASATADCQGGMGVIGISIVDDAPWTYTIWIDEVTVAEDETDTDGGFAVYGPYEDGDHLVEVGWNQEEMIILQTTVTVDCSESTTTSGETADTSAAPTTTAAAAPTATPRYTG